MDLKIAQSIIELIKSLSANHELPGFTDLNGNDSTKGASIHWSSEGKVKADGFGIPSAGGYNSLEHGTFVSVIVSLKSPNDDPGKFLKAWITLTTDGGKHTAVVGADGNAIFFSNGDEASEVNISNFLFGIEQKLSSFPNSGDSSPK